MSSSSPLSLVTLSASEGASARSPDPSSHWLDMPVTRFWAPRGRTLGPKRPFRDRGDDEENGTAPRSCMLTTRQI